MVLARIGGVHEERLVEVSHIRIPIEGPAEVIGESA
jgi:hypothetical protein